MVCWKSDCTRIHRHAIPGFMLLHSEWDLPFQVVEHLKSSFVHGPHLCLTLSKSGSVLRPGAAVSVRL